MKVISEKFFLKAVNFKEFIRIGEQNLIDNQRAFDDVYLRYAALNLHRTKRVLKTVELYNSTVEAVRMITKKQNWLVLSESWCGDAAHSVPVMAKMEELTENIEMKLLFRDENPELMDSFLTRGGRSIPKLIVTDENHQVIATWGPRPKKSQAVYEKAVKENGIDVAFEILQRWYNQDKSNETQKELTLLVTQVEEALKK